MGLLSVGRNFESRGVPLWYCKKKDKQSAQNFLDHAHLVKNLGTVAQGNNAQDVVMVVLHCALFETGEGKI